MATTKTATRKTTVESATPRQADMTHSDSMPIVTPRTSGRARKTALATVESAAIPVVTEEVSPQGKRRRRWALLLLVLLLVVLGFWFYRTFYRAAGAPVDIQPPIPAPIHAASPPPAVSIPAPAAATVLAQPAVTAAPVVATAPAETLASPPPAAPPTKLLEVSVGTSVRGGLTMKFDRPVNWSVLGNEGQGSVEVAVLGVRDLGTFPRNLPLPPGVKVIHAGIIEPDTLRLSFTLLRGVRAVTAPADRPATTLNIFFRTAREIAALPALPQTLQPSGGCGVAAAPRIAKAIQLLQASLDKDSSYAEVRMALAMLATCGGDGARAEHLLASGPQGAGDPQLQLVAADAALRFARGDADGAIQFLKSNAGTAKASPGYAALIADLQAAR
ncbi:MAG TPA: hypothetical protein VGM16_11175 [Gammaproteobacteria bacterium]|jgi:hypothetical protein